MLLTSSAAFMIEINGTLTALLNTPSASNLMRKRKHKTNNHQSIKLVYFGTSTYLASVHTFLTWTPFWVWNLSKKTHHPQQIAFILDLFLPLILFQFLSTTNQIICLIPSESSQSITIVQQVVLKKNMQIIHQKSPLVQSVVFNTLTSFIYCGVFRLGLTTFSVYALILQKERRKM